MRKGNDVLVGSDAYISTRDLRETSMLEFTDVAYCFLSVTQARTYNCNSFWPSLRIILKEIISEENNNFINLSRVTLVVVVSQCIQLQEV